MSHWIALPAILPLLAAATSVVVGRFRSAQRAIGLGTLGALLVIAGWMVVETDRNDVLTTQAGGWTAPLGITLVADRFSAVMLLVSVAMLLVVLVYAIGQGDGAVGPAACVVEDPVQLLDGDVQRSADHRGVARRPCLAHRVDSCVASRPEARAAP